MKLSDMLSYVLPDSHIFSKFSESTDFWVVVNPDRNVAMPKVTKMYQYVAETTR